MSRLRRLPFVFILSCYLPALAYGFWLVYALDPLAFKPFHYLRFLGFFVIAATTLAGGITLLYQRSRTR